MKRILVVQTASKAAADVVLSKIAELPFVVCGAACHDGTITAEINTKDDDLVSAHIVIIDKEVEKIDGKGVVAAGTREYDDENEYLLEAISEDGCAVKG